MNAGDSGSIDILGRTESRPCKVGISHCACIDKIYVAAHYPLQLLLQLEVVVEEPTTSRKEVDEEVDVAVLAVEPVAEHRPEDAKPLHSMGFARASDRLHIDGHRGDHAAIVPRERDS